VQEITARFSLEEGRERIRIKDVVRCSSGKSDGLAGVGVRRHTFEGGAEMAAEARFKTFEYAVDSKTLTEKTGELSAEGMPNIITSAPPEFKGEAGLWPPEQLFVSSYAACLLIRFLGYGKREGVEYESWSCRAVGRMVREEQGWVIDRIDAYARVEVRGPEMAKKADEVLTLADNRCPISNSMKSEVVLHREIVDISSG